jgi:hypothetical protein
MLGAACSGTEGTKGKPPPASEVGQCHRLSDADIEAMATYGSDAACDVHHNGYTYLVGKLDDLPDEPGALPATPARRACWDALPAVLGRSADDIQATLFDFAAFLPTPEDQELGADWYRCDLIAHGRGWFYQDLPDGAPDEFPSDLPIGYYACIDYTTESEITSGERIPCGPDASHWWAGSFEGPSELEPGQLRKLTWSHCPGIAKTRYWYSTFPDPRQWAAGNHMIACYGNALDPDWLTPFNPPAPV